MTSLLAEFPHSLAQPAKILAGVLLATLLMAGSPAVLTEAIAKAPVESSESQQDSSSKECVSPRRLGSLVTRSNRAYLAGAACPKKASTLAAQHRYNWLLDASAGKLLGGGEHSLRNGLGTALRN